MFGYAFYYYLAIVKPYLKLFCLAVVIGLLAAIIDGILPTWHLAILIVFWFGIYIGKLK